MAWIHKKLYIDIITHIITYTRYKYDLIWYTDKVILKILGHW